MQKQIKIKETKESKICSSEDYNYIFHKISGHFMRWGKTPEEDPDYAPLPEIADIEISTGSCLGKCSFCYKENGGSEAHHMSFEVYKKLIKKIKGLLCQVALGITDCYANPDFFEILKWTRKQGIIPNYTTHGIDVDDFVVKQTKKYCGAVAVSIVNKEKSYDAIKKFTDAGMNQVNIHFMLSNETHKRAFQIVDDICTDPRLSKLNALVFLGLKKKGMAEERYSYLNDQEKFNALIKYCTDKKVNIGFDSCSCGSYYKSIENNEMKDSLAMYAEPCESFGLFSSYFNYKGEYFPCSFAEGVGEWKEGLDALNCDDFMKDIWFSEKLNKWRKISLESTKGCDCSFKKICRSCPIFPELVYCKDL